VASTTSAGDGGDIGFTGGHVLISGIGSTGNASAISSSAAGSGDAGAVAISASLVDIVGGGLIAASTSNTGSGGSVVISSDRVNISGTDTRGNASAIATTSSGMSSDLGSAPGDAGSTTLAAGELRLTDGGSITTEADEASGGNIDLHVGKLIYLKDSSITTSVLGGSGNGGNITIDPKILLLDHSTIAANAIEGHGGNINIVADNFIQSPDSTITASSQLGLSGAIAISSPETDIVQRLVAIGATFVDPSQQLSASCASRSGSVESSLVSGWRGGLPADPGRLLLGGYLGDLPPRQGAAPSGAKSRKPALVAFSAQPLRFGCGGPAAP
jgi:large exoprotein involved in heme utilization and adhesion